MKKKNIPYTIITVVLTVIGLSVFENQSALQYTALGLAVAIGIFGAFMKDRQAKSKT